MAIVMTNSTLQRNTMALDSAAVAEGGASAGIVAGVVMAVVGMVLAATMGYDLLMPARLVAGVFYGSAAPNGGWDVATVGLLIHVLVSAALGVAFAFAIGIKPRKPTIRAANTIPQLAGTFTLLASALGFGVFVWAVMTFIVLPLVNPVMRENVAAMPVAWFIEHLVFGATLIATPYLENWFQNRENRMSTKLNPKI